MFSPHRKTKHYRSSPLFVFIHQAQQRDAFIQERYGQYDLSDPFLALQRDSESEERQNMLSCSPVHPQGRAVGPNPLAVLKLVMAHCKRMQERMMGQLAAAENRHKKVSLPAGTTVREGLNLSTHLLTHGDFSHTLGECSALSRSSSKSDSLLEFQSLSERFGQHR